MKLREMLQSGEKILKEANISEFRSNAEKTLMFILGMDRTSFILNLDKEIDSDKEEFYFNVINKRSQGIPLQYITTTQYFMDLEFYVDENVLIPRQDTEILVDEVLKYSKGKKKLSILDLCTGSGAIAISLAKYLKEDKELGAQEFKVYALDISEKALEVAEKNARANKAIDDIIFIKADMFDGIKDILNIEPKFDIIVSNPPYIKSEEIEKLSVEVKEHEPRIALDGGNDGLKFYRIIADKALSYLKENGILALEIGFDQAEDIRELLKDKFNKIEVIKDFNGLDRVIIARNGGKYAR